MLFQKLFSLLFEFGLNLLQFSLFFYSLVEFCFFSFGLLLKSPLLLLLLLQTSKLKLLSFLSSHFSLNSIFLSGSSFICLDCSLRSQSIQLSLPIRCLLLKFPELLNFLFFFLFYSPSINVLILLLSDYLCLLLSLFLNVLSNFLFLTFFFGFSLFNHQDGISVGLYDFFIDFVLLNSLFLNKNLRTSFCNYSSLSSSFLFMIKIWASLSCSSFCFSLSIYRALICSIMTSFPLRASYFFLSSISSISLIFLSRSIYMSLSFFFSWIL